MMPEPEGSDHGADVDGQSEEEPPYVAPRVPSIDCPLEILIEFARGRDSKSPLKQFVVRITVPTATSQELMHTFFGLRML